MKRRAFLGTSAGVSAGMLLRSVPALAQPAPRTRQPNVILIVCDDLDARPIDEAASIPRFMPRLQDLLVDRGTTFTHAYVTTPLCTPSRISIYTGRYPHNTGAINNDGYRWFYGSGGERLTAATLLQAAGYRTVLLGKYVNAFSQVVDYPEYIPPGWDEWYVPLVNASYWDYHLNANGTQVYYGDSSKQENYVVDVISRYAVDFILRMGGRPEPFFMHVAPVAPHKPALPAPRYGRVFNKLPAPRVPSFDEADVSDKPDWLRLRKPRIDASNQKLLDKLYGDRLAAMMAVDDLVRDLLQALRITDQLENTVVAFTSDNGWQTGEHRLTEGKTFPYEESIRVPLIVRGPGVPQGRKTDALVSNVDLLPTWCDLAGIPAPPDADGRSLVPLFRQNLTPANSWRQEVLVEFLDPDGSESPPYRLIRTASGWMYLEYEWTEVEAYDMNADPFQLDNLGKIAPPRIPASLPGRLRQLASCGSQQCR